MKMTTLIILSALAYIVIISYFIPEMVRFKDDTDARAYQTKSLLDPQSEGKRR